MLIEQKYQIIQVVRCASNENQSLEECKLEFSLKSHYSNVKDYARTCGGYQSIITNQ